MKAEDLQKALDPSVWPIRVKVREYIFYAKRQPRPDGAAGVKQQHGDGQAGGQGQQVPAGLVPAGPVGQVPAGPVGQWHGATTANMFAVLENPSAPAEAKL